MYIKNMHILYHLLLSYYEAFRVFYFNDLDQIM